MTIASDARNLLRDFPKYFEQVFVPPMQSTLHLSHPLVTNLAVTDRATGDPVTTAGSYSVDERNGLLRLHSTNPTADYPSGVTVGGYFYEWFLPSDLEFHARFVANEHMMSRGSDTTVGDLPAVELNVIAMGTVVQALWSLLSEFATEYDVINPEGISVPVRQRFAQVMQLFQVWQKKYEEGAVALNVGFNRISVTEIRRVSRLTGRLVPIFEEREVDDPSYPRRILPAIEAPFADGNEGGFVINGDTGAAVGGWPM
jgi:hypothetical protein